MRTALPAALILALLAGTAQARGPSTPAQALAGRIAGTPQQCIAEPQIDDSDTYDSGDILYRMKSGPLYLNSPHCPGLRSGVAIVTRTPSTRICRGDIAEIVDFHSHFNYGACTLGEFVPYTRDKRQ